MSEETNDHCVNVPLSADRGDFDKPEKLLVYSAHTEGYEGEPVDGVDRIFEASGDFVSAVFRVMPEENWLPSNGRTRH